MHSIPGRGGIAGVAPTAAAAPAVGWRLPHATQRWALVAASLIEADAASPATI